MLQWLDRRVVTCGYCWLPVPDPTPWQGLALSPQPIGKASRRASWLEIVEGGATHVFIVGSNLETELR